MTVTLFGEEGDDYIEGHHLASGVQQLQGNSGNDKLLLGSEATGA